MDRATRAEAQRWIDKAQHDLRTGQLALGDKPPMEDTATFHAQQCAEKCLKAYLVLVGDHIERTHDLVRLVELRATHDKEFHNLDAPADALSHYAVGPRCPSEFSDPTGAEAADALRQAQVFMSFALDKLGPL